VEGSLVHEVEARLVAVEQGELWLGCEVAEGGGDAGAAVLAGVGGEAAGQELGFHGPGAAHAPVRGHHFLNQGFFDAIDGAEPIQVLRKEGLEALLRLAGQDDTLGEETVTDSILGRAGFAFRGRGATGKSAVGLRRKLSSCRTHIPPITILRKKSGILWADRNCSVYALFSIEFLFSKPVTRSLLFG
jgi:hypothetical protein